MTSPLMRPLLAGAAVLLGLYAAGPSRADSFLLAPDNPADLARATAPVMSAAEKADFLQRFYARRERVAATAVAAAGEFDADAAGGVRGTASTDPSRAKFSELPDTLTIGKNRKNTLAEAAA